MFDVRVRKDEHRTFNVEHRMVNERSSSMPAWKAGTASTVIKPDEPLWLAGYAARTSPAKGKISDLHVTALALEDAAGGRVVIASADTIAITSIVSEPAFQRVFEKTGLSRERLILAASHTHYAPE